MSWLIRIVTTTRRTGVGAFALRDDLNDNAVLRDDLGDGSILIDDLAA